jgi:exodeoxyribonuclease VII large subunit
MQPTLFSTQQWTVSRLTFYIRKLLEENESLQDVWVQGEISNLSRPASGHVYFTLKDSAAALKCVIWKKSATRLGVALQDGMEVEVHGRIGIYEVSGQYQLYADQVRPVGEGALYQEFLRLKSLLEAEGLFAPEHKRFRNGSVLSLPRPARRCAICSIHCDGVCHWLRSFLRHPRFRELKLLLLS